MKKDPLVQAEAARQRSNFKSARQLFYKATKASLDALQAWQGVADCSRLLGDFKPALQAYAKALRFAGPEERADLIAGQGLAYRGLGQPQKALQALQAANQAYVARRDLAGQAFSAWAIGGAWRIAGDQAQGLRWLKRAWTLYTKLKDAEGLSYTACALGGVQRMLGNFKASEAYYAQANQRMRARKDRFGIAYSYCGQGNAHRMRGDYKTALLYFKKAEKSYLKIGDKVSYAYTLWSLATAYKLLWRGKDAEKALSKAEKLFQSTGDERGLAYAALTRAEIAFLRKQNGPALRLQKRALALAKPFAWESRHAKALSALMSGDLKKANAAYAGSRSKFRPNSFPINWP